MEKSEWPFHYRINNYRNRIKSTPHERLLPVEQHFRLEKHDFNSHAKFTIIERIEIDTQDKVRKILEEHEDKWILRLKTLCPCGFNHKLNTTDRINI